METRKSIMPKVSVIIPTFNRSAYLQEAISSVLAQDADFELIVVDNASSDNTAAVVAAFDDGRIRYHRQERDVGSVRNSQTGLALAQGEYAAFLFDDDTWHPDFLAKTGAALDAHDHAVCAFTNHGIMRADGSVDEVASAQHDQLYARADLKSGFYQPFLELAIVKQSLAFGCILFRRDVMPSEHLIDARAGKSGDLWATIQLALTGQGAYYIAEKLALYRMHAHQDSTTGGEGMARGSIWCYRQLLQMPAHADLHPFLRSQLALHSVSLAKHLMLHGHAGEARVALREALRNGARDKRTWGFVLLSLLPVNAMRTLLTSLRRVKGRAA